MSASRTIVARLWPTLVRGIAGSRNRRELAVGSTGILLLRVAALGLGFGSTLILARALGADELGTYSWALAWATVLQLVCTIGFDRLAVRETAGFAALGDWASVRGFIAVAQRTVGTASVMVTLVCGIAGLVFASGEQRQPLVIAVAIVPILSLSVLRQGVLQGLGRVVAGRAPEDLVKPAFLVVLFVLAWTIFGCPRDATVAMLLQAGSSVGAFACGAVLLTRRLGAIGPQGRHAWPRGRWVREAVPLALLNGVTVLLAQIDIVLLGLLSASTEVGLYALAVRLAQFVGLAEFAVNAAFMPVVARLVAVDDMARLKQGAARVAAVGLLLACILALPFIVSPGWFLSLFGATFSGGEWQLRLLALSYIVSALAGQNGAILTMARATRPVVLGTLVALVTNVVANLLLIPLYGSRGAAAAWVVSTVVWNGLLAVVVRRRFGFYATPFSLLRRRLDAR